MADPRFFSRRGPFTISELASMSGTEPGPGVEGSQRIEDVAPLDTAGPRALSFLGNPRYIEAFSGSAAGACIIHPTFAEHAPSGMALLLGEEPYRSYALAAQAFYPEHHPVPGIDPSAHIAATARLGDGCAIGPGVVIGENAVIGARCSISANVVIGPAVEIGRETRIGALVSLSHCLIGSRVAIYPGVRIGQDGFGFSRGPAGHVKVPQLGRVIIHDDVEIGANTTIDRGAGPDTIIGEGSWIDNLVQIGHNVQLGRACIIVAQAGIAGSVTLGDRVVVGGQVGIVGHLTIGRGAQIAGKSGVVDDLPDGARVGGSPAVPIRVWHRQTVLLARMAKKKGTADE
jgi:UDP-3-O-[3-hydroxymyristoyl] glucosamine N-acyltransferase